MPRNDPLPVTSADRPLSLWLDAELEHHDRWVDHVARSLIALPAPTAEMQEFRLQSLEAILGKGIHRWVERNG